MSYPVCDYKATPKNHCVKGSGERDHKFCNRFIDSTSGKCSLRKGDLNGKDVYLYKYPASAPEWESFSDAEKAKFGPTKVSPKVKQIGLIKPIHVPAHAPAGTSVAADSTPFSVPPPVLPKFARQSPSGASAVSDSKEADLKALFDAVAVVNRLSAEIKSKYSLSDEQLQEYMAELKRSNQSGGARRRKSRKSRKSRSKSAGRKRSRRGARR